MMYRVTYTGPAASIAAEGHSFPRNMPVDVPEELLIGMFGATSVQSPHWVIEVAPPPPSPEPEEDDAVDADEDADDDDDEEEE